MYIIGGLKGIYIEIKVLRETMTPFFLRNTRRLQLQVQFAHSIFISGENWYCGSLVSCQN